jgi:hypothetical protein
MQSMAIHTFLCCLSALTGGRRPSQEEHVQTPSSKSSQLLGSWSCAGNFRNGKVHRASYTDSMILSGKWLELTETDLEPATRYVAKYLIGYETQGGHLVEFDANTFGAATYSSKDGWQRGVLTMEAHAYLSVKAPYVADRFVYTIGGAKTFTVDWQIQKTAEDSWVTSDHLLCERTD